MTTTKAKCEFYFHMARHSQATPSQVQRLLRYAATLQRLAEQDCNAGLSEREQRKQGRIEERVREIVREWIAVDGSGSYGITFSGDPRGCVLKIRVPDGFTDDIGGEGICVPA